MKLQQEQEVQEREQNHEMRLMEMFTMMIQRTHGEAQPQAAQHPHMSQNLPLLVYTELHNAPGSNNCHSPFNFP